MKLRYRAHAGDGTAFVPTLPIILVDGQKYQPKNSGAAGLGLLMGSRVQGKMIGEFPGLKRLDSLGNLRPTADFRSIYCSLIEQHLHTDAQGIIPRASKFGRPQLIR